METRILPLDSLVPDPAQPRQAMPSEELDQLAASIRDRGLLLPLRVKPANTEDRHVIVSGHRRHAALVQLGATEAPCIIGEGPLDEASILAEQLAENIVRANLTPLEEAQGYRRYLALRGVTAAQAATELSVSPSRISRLLPLLTLPEEIRAKIEAGVLAADAAYHLTRLSEGEEHTRLFAAAAAGTLSRDAAARAAKKPVAAAAGSVMRVSCSLPGGRVLTFSGPEVRLDSLIAASEEVLKEARKALRQGLDVTTFARIFRDRSAKGGASC